METIQSHPLLFALALSVMLSAITLLLSYFYWSQRAKSWKRERMTLLDDKTALSQTQKLYQQEQLAHIKLQSEHEHVLEQLDSQKSELTDLHKQLYDQFENLANRILDSKSQKFSAENSKQIKSLIEPLGKEIKAFQEKVNEEAKERFSLAKMLFRFSGHYGADGRTEKSLAP